MPENIDTGRKTRPAAKRKSAERRSAPRVSVPRVSTGHSSVRNAASETSSIPLASKTISAVSEPTAPSTIGFHRGGIRNAMTAPAAHRMKNAANSWAVMLISAPQSALAREIPASTVAFSRRRQARREGSPKVGAGGQRDVGSAGLRRDEEAEPVHVVIGIVDLPRLADAGPTRPGIDEAHMEGAAKDASELAQRRPGLVGTGGPFVTRLPRGGRFHVTLTAEAMDAPPVIDRDRAIAARDRAGG